MRKKSTNLWCLLSALVLVGVGMNMLGCRTRSERSSTKDAIMMEGGPLGAQVVVFYADQSFVHRGACPLASPMSTAGNYRIYCPPNQSVSISQFSDGMKKANQMLYGRPMSAQQEAMIPMLMNVLRDPTRTISYHDNPWYGEESRQLVALFPQAMIIAVTDAARGGGNNDGSDSGWTPVPGPRPSEGIVSGPNHVSLLPGQPTTFFLLGQLAGRRISNLRFEFNPGCRLTLDSVTGMNNEGEGVKFTYNLNDQRWRAEREIALDRIMGIITGVADTCMMTVKSPDLGGNPNQPSDTGIPQGDSYYMTLFGYQRQNLIGALFDPKSAHTFASYVQVRKTGADVRVVQESTISWLPRDNDGDVVINTPVPGLNWTLQDSIRKGMGGGIEIRRYGPFPISKDLYDRVISRKNFVDQWANFGATRAIANRNYYSGQAMTLNLRLFENGIYYIAVDPLLRAGTLNTPPSGAMNCFHAVGDVLATGRSEDWLTNGGARGWKATEQTLEYYLFRAHMDVLDYPQSNLNLFVQKYRPVADISGFGQVPHAPSVPRERLPRAQDGRPAYPAASPGPGGMSTGQDAPLPADWGSDPGAVQ